jgi:hypothetical protein
MPKFLDLSNQRFGRLLAVSVVRRGGAVHWHCQCDCGSSKVVQANHLRRGRTQSCGCLHKELLADRVRKHAKSNTFEFRVWCHMRRRCGSPTNPRFADYGGRGILVCERWADFSQFLADMGHAPSPNHSIDRIDNNGNYEPGNCRWATNHEQSRNTRRTRLLTIAGQTMCLKDWAARIGIGDRALSARIARGWPEDRLLLGAQR